VRLAPGRSGRGGQPGVADAGRAGRRPWRGRAGARREPGDDRVHGAQHPRVRRRARAGREDRRRADLRDRRGAEPGPGDLRRPRARGVRQPARLPDAGRGHPPPGAAGRRGRAGSGRRRAGQPVAVVKIREIERMAPVHRRRFLKLLSAAVAAPMVPSAVRYAANAIAGGEAYAAAREGELPRYFIEINLRDQWDHGHLMVAPGLATYANLRRGEDGTKAALFFGSDELSQHQVNGTTVYLTNES